MRDATTVKFVTKTLGYSEESIIVGVVVDWFVEVVHLIRDMLLDTRIAKLEFAKIAT